MANDPELDVTPGKSAHERFADLGKRVLSVPKAEVEQREKAWQAEQKRTRIKPGPKRRNK